jgi:5,10-methylene-tetrahydrofolate dehydrogenase/methenyl tetrahydrofolate cyclohydrolase
MSEQNSPRPEIVFSDAPEVHISKATNLLKKKAGSGGFDPRAVAAAEKRMAEAANLFPKIAASDIEVISYALRQLEHATQTKEWMERIQWAAAELKSNSIMFQYPLVAAVAQSLCEFFEKSKALTALGREVVALHLQTLRIALEQGPRAVTKNDETQLLSGLGKASAKALQE